MNQFPYKAGFRAANSGLWSVVGLLPVFLLTIVALEFRTDGSLNRVGLVIGSTIALLTGLGLFRRWGPLIPCTLVGMVVLTLLSSHIASSYEEAVFQDLGLPLIGAVCGSIVGFCIEFHWRHAASDQQEQHGKTPL